MFNYKKKAFTLIEMLIVIAIVGILSSVVLFALSPSRNKAKDARVIADLHEVMSNAPSVYDPISGLYDVGVLVKLTSSTLREIESINNNNCYIFFGGSDKRGCTSGIFYNKKVSLFSIYAKLPSGGYYCVDSQGGSKSVQNFSPDFNAPPVCQ